MGQKNSSSHNNKLLILTFDEFYTELAYKNLSQNNNYIQIKDGFINEPTMICGKKFSIWFLSPENRHLWKHYYIGAEAIILFFSVKDEKIEQEIIIEVLNIFCDNLLKTVPILFLVDKNYNNLKKDLFNSIEEISESRREHCKNYFFDFFDGENINLASDNKGINWLAQFFLNNELENNVCIDKDKHKERREKKKAKKIDLL